MDEGIEAVNLCALHCEMRNLEYLLRSLGLQAYNCGTLDECNKALSKHGPASFHGNRIMVKPHRGQQTAITIQNIKVASFSGMCKCAQYNAL